MPSVNAVVARNPIEVKSLADFFRLREEWKAAEGVPLIYRDSDDAPRISFPGQETRLLVSGEQSGGRFAIFDVTVAPNFAAPHHHQNNEDEWWYIIEGDLEITVADKTLTVGRGASAYIPIGCRHSFANRTDSPVRLVTINAPAGHERFFEALRDSDDLTDAERRTMTENHDVAFHDDVVETLRY